jgi:hypothetical protein
MLGAKSGEEHPGTTLSEDEMCRLVAPRKGAEVERNHKSYALNGVGEERRERPPGAQNVFRTVWVILLGAAADKVHEAT